MKYFYGGVVRLKCLLRGQNKGREALVGSLGYSFKGFRDECGR